MIFCHRHVLKHLCHTLCRPAQSQQRLKALHCQQRELLPWAFAFAATCTKGKPSEQRQLVPWAFAFAVYCTKGKASLLAVCTIFLVTDRPAKTVVCCICMRDESYFLCLVMRSVYATYHRGPYMVNTVSSIHMDVPTV